MLTIANYTSWSTSFSRPLSLKFGRELSILIPTPQSFSHFICTQLLCLFFCVCGAFLLVLGVFLSLNGGDSVGRGVLGHKKVFTETCLTCSERKWHIYWLKRLPSSFNFWISDLKSAHPLAPVLAYKMPIPVSDTSGDRAYFFTLCHTGLYFLSVLSTAFSNKAVNNAGT